MVSKISLNFLRPSKEFDSAQGGPPKKQTSKDVGALSMQKHYIKNVIYGHPFFEIRKIFGKHYICPSLYMVMPPCTTTKGDEVGVKKCHVFSNISLGVRSTRWFE